jgi:hypothetical protein
MTLNDCTECHYAERLLCCVTILYIMLNVVMLNVVMLNVIMLNVSMLNVIMLNVIILNVIMLNAVAQLFFFWSVSEYQL